MKTNTTSKTKRSAKLRGLLLKVAEAEKQLQAAREQTRQAKATFKQSRKTLKAAKKAAKTARKKAKAAAKTFKATKKSRQQKARPAAARSKGSLLATAPLATVAALQPAP